ncbi:MAG: bifunctional UDP-N-acetylglucosamine diphosphorylase/glucosamine-1-phosphate N-acetyltransferase GlmU [Lachnospirales bacterium]
MENLKVVILAAGQGTRMKSDVPKVLHRVLDKTMVGYVIEASKEAGADEICTIVGHQSAMVKNTIKDMYDGITFAVQKEQLGTGHAVMQAGDFIKSGNILVLCGDTPLITADTIKKLCDIHEENNNSVTVVSMVVDNPTGYGRIVRENDKFSKIVEQKDANAEEQAIKEVNTGVYIFKAESLNKAFESLSNNNSQGEYYLTDTLEIIKNSGENVGVMVAEDPEEFMGVNSKLHLAQAIKAMKNRINTKLMIEGVTITDPDNTYIGKDVKIQRDTIIYPGCMLEGKTVIGKSCIIGPNTRMTSAVVDDCVTIQSSVLMDCKVKSFTTVGPFAYIRPNSVIGEHVRIGDFVEVKNSNIDDGTKVSHLTYVGDSDVGKCVNFGCGTVTVNYDGKSKNRCKIGDGAFIGCNTNLVAPVEIAERAYTAAGSTITRNVPEDSLAIARVRQENKDGWRKKVNK